MAGQRNAFAPANTSSAMYGTSGDEQWLQDMSATSAQNQKYARGGSTMTQLAPQEEAAFQQWVRKNRVPFNPRDPMSDYDMRGFFKALVTGDPNAQTAVNQTDGRMHFPDQWKTPFHHSFSNESQYANAFAPRWINDTQAADPRTGDVTWDEQYFGRTTPIDSRRLPPARRR